MSTKPHYGFTRHGVAVHARTTDHLPRGNPVARFNARIAVLTTKGVGTMWCAYVFAIFDCLALPTALHQGLYGIVQWVASFFLQLVLLSVIMVGQNLQSVASDARAAKTFEDTEKIVDRLDEHTDGGIKAILDYLRNMDSHDAGLLDEIHRHVTALAPQAGQFAPGQPVVDDPPPATDDSGRPVRADGSVIPESPEAAKRRETRIQGGPSRKLQRPGGGG